MDKFRTTVVAAALLLCFSTVSVARTTPVDVNSADSVTTQVALPLSFVDPALRLPTETDAKTNVEIDPASAVPLSEITFRPVNGRFRHRSRRPCRHHFKLYPSAMRENEEISYGNDMILSSGENSDFDQPIARGVIKRIPGRWMRMRHHQHQHRLRRNRDEESDDEEEEDRSKKVVFRRYDYDRFDREKKLKKLRKHFRVGKEETEKKKKGGFMIRIRKFLEHYV